MSSEKGKWSSGFGFIMASAGSAIGLGNIWKFPYMTARNGGGMFLLFYIIFALGIGVPVLLAELAVGRYAQKNAVDSCREINPKWGFAGYFGVICSVLVLSFYSVVGGWVIKYLSVSAFSGIPSPLFFGEYSVKAYEPILFQALFILICALIVIKGVSGGIEKCSEIMLPLLIVFLIGIMFFVFGEENAAEGIKYFLLPRVSEEMPLSEIILAAMGQMFFSLSLGMGTLITYGSYLSKENDLIKSTFTIVILDTVIALIAGLVIIPSAYAFGGEISAGAGMIFETLPAVFAKIRGGRIIMTVMFLLILLAAVTSAISLLEVFSSFLADRVHLKRKPAVLLSAGLCLAVGIAASLSFGVLSDVKIFNMSIFDFVIYLADNVIMPVGAVSICILAGRKWGKENLKREISLGRKKPLRSGNLIHFILNYASPAIIITAAVINF